jgi:hypothetical protein
MPEPQHVVVVHLYKQESLPRLVSALKSGRWPEKTEFFLGSYGIRPSDAKEIAKLPGGHYAPTFHLGPAVDAEFRSGRHDLPPGTAPFDKEFAGAMPVHPNEPWLPSEKPNAWGVELGRRFRDKLRSEQQLRTGVKIENWQLDEIPRECGNNSRRKDFRMFVGGVVRGLAEGRPRFKDKLLKGFVWIGAGALETLPGADPREPTVELFWKDVNKGARYLVGEEYPAFVRGAATTTGRSLARPQVALAAPGSKPRQELAARYIVGMTPGFHRPMKKSGLNGNVGGMKLPAVAAWREEFITARIEAARPCGYGMFHFDGHFNTRPECIQNAITALNFAVSKHATP